MCRKRDTFKSTLESLPKTLDETYLRILDEIPEADKESCIRILQFLMFSERPLRSDEVNDLIAIPTESQLLFDPRNRMRPEDIPAVCSSLVTVTEEEPYAVIQLSHFSVKEYLSSDRLETKFQRFFAESKARESIVELSIRYISSIALRLNAPVIKVRYPFAEYAACHWIDHASVAEKSECVRKCILHFFFPEMQVPYLNWLELFDPDQLSQSHSSENQVSYRSWLEQLFHSDRSDGESGSEQTSDLDDNFAWGHDQIIDASETSPPDGGPSPIYYTSLHGLSRTTKDLIIAGAVVNGSGGSFGPALQAACLMGHRDIAEILLDNGADVDGKVPKSSGTALIATISGGDEDLATLLLERGADANLSGYYPKDSRKVAFPVCLASDKGSENMVRLLLEHGAKPETKDDKFQHSALVKACYRSHYNVVKLLLDSGADANFNNRLRTPLISASTTGNIDIIRLLLDHSADPNSEVEVFNYATTALFAACVAGNHAAVELLCSNGANVNALMPVHGSALKYALTFKDEQIAISLFSKGARFEATSHDGGSSEHTALDKKTSINNQGPQQIEALRIACKRGFARFSKLLINRYLESERLTIQSSDFLQIASYWGNRDIVQKLLSDGAFANSVAGPYGTALQAASVKGDLEVVRLLLDEGADPNAMDWHGWPARTIASKNGHMDIAQALAPVTINYPFRTCLYPSAIRRVGGYPTDVYHQKTVLEVGKYIHTGLLRFFELNLLHRPVSTRTAVPGKSPICSNGATRLFRGEVVKQRSPPVRIKKKYAFH